MQCSEECKKKMKTLVNDVLNITETMGVIRTQLLTNNKKGENNEKIISMVQVLCSYCIQVELEARLAKSELQRGECLLEYDVEPADV